jgi:integrase
MHKTKDPVSIPLIDKAVKLIGEREGFDAQNVFRVPSNQVANRFLKEIATAAEIDKTVTFHVSRHTFATNSITLGIPIEVVSKLLGHTSLKNTMIYAKVVDGAKIAYMDLWNKSDDNKKVVNAKPNKK